MIFRVSCLPKVAGDPRDLDHPKSMDDVEDWIARVKAGEERMTKALSGLMHDAMVQFPSLPDVKFDKNDDVTCLFPRDLLKEGLGTELIVEIFGFSVTDGSAINAVAVLGLQLAQEFADANLPQCKMIKSLARPIGGEEWLESWFREVADETTEQYSGSLAQVEAALDAAGVADVDAHRIINSVRFEHGQLAVEPEVTPEKRAEKYILQLTDTGYELSADTVLTVEGAIIRYLKTQRLPHPPGMGCSAD